MKKSLNEEAIAFPIFEILLITFPNKLTKPDENAPNFPMTSVKRLENCPKILNGTCKRDPAICVTLPTIPFPTSISFWKRFPACPLIFAITWPVAFTILPAASTAWLTILPTIFPALSKIFPASSTTPAPT